MPDITILCTFCAEPVDVERDYREVIGFERKRDQGGTNAIRLRRNTDRWAHRGCIDMEASGVSAGQGSLV